MPTLGPKMMVSNRDAMSGVMLREARLPLLSELFQQLGEIRSRHVWVPTSVSLSVIERYGWHAFGVGRYII